MIPPSGGGWQAPCSRAGRSAASGLPPIARRQLFLGYRETSRADRRGSALTAGGKSPDGSCCGRRGSGKSLLDLAPGEFPFRRILRTRALISLHVSKSRTRHEARPAAETGTACNQAVTSICRGRASSLFGTDTVSTPFFRLAEMLFTSTVVGSWKLRKNFPYQRSKRW
jgi:hypothetical protein